MPGNVGTENATVHVYLNDNDWWERDTGGGLQDIFLDQDDLMRSLRLHGLRKREQPQGWIRRERTV